MREKSAYSRCNIFMTHTRIRKASGKISETEGLEKNLCTNDEVIGDESMLRVLENSDVVSRKSGYALVNFTTQLRAAASNVLGNLKRYVSRGSIFRMWNLFLRLERAGG